MWPSLCRNFFAFFTTCSFMRLRNLEVIDKFAFLNSRSDGSGRGGRRKGRFRREKLVKRLFPIHQVHNRGSEITQQMTVNNYVREITAMKCQCHQTFGTFQTHPLIVFAVQLSELLQEWARHGLLLSCLPQRFSHVLSWVRMRKNGPFYGGNYTLPTRKAKESGTISTKGKGSELWRLN